MRATVDAKTFAQALDQVSGLIHKSVIPVLNGVLVRFEEGRCTLASTNLNTWLSVGMPAQGDSFAFLLDRPRESARAFRQFEGELALEQTETGEGDRRRIKLALSCGPRSAELHPFLPDDFPEQQAWDPMPSLKSSSRWPYWARGKNGTMFPRIRNGWNGSPPIPTPSPASRSCPRVTTPSRPDRWR